ncbi:SpoIIE family protein phosphatase [Marinobacter bohaiensis]|uniref:SpoIIE family protein phosphatase n=1 Tax=Marinobacter bohaiensis TaxID=2201898 RepID=UPI000DADB361|nr:SpoIIE family protein phosphatase [Marinobacter bohaiensis]
MLGALLTLYYQSRTETLLMDTADSLFNQAASEITRSFRETYRPVNELTSLLSRSPLTSDTATAARATNLPIFASALRRQSATVAIQIGYDNGDYYIVRAVRSQAIADRFESPHATAFITDFLVQEADGQALLTRRFLRSDLSQIEQRRLPPMHYDPRTRPWYRAAQASDDVIVTDPYAFHFFRQPGLTVARSTGDRRAVVASDVTLRSLSSTLSDLSITPSAQSILYLPSGDVMAYGKASPLVVSDANHNARMARLDDLDVPILLSVNQEGDSAPEGWLEKTVELPLTPELKPRLAIAAPRREILGDAYRIWDRALWAAVAIIVLTLPLTWLIARSVSNPIRALQSAAARISEGDFDARLPRVRHRDEVGDLTQAFDRMQDSLKDHMSRLQATTAAKERLESELGIAHDIQMSMVAGEGHLARTFDDWQVDATLQPARAVGGDLFDVAELPGNRLLVAIGDVSDKGVPAALFMARTVSLLKLLYGQGRPLAALMTELNRHLSQDNESCMFVTLLCLMVDRTSGHIEMASAGHDAPVICDRNPARLLAVENGPPMGLYEDAGFPGTQIELPAGSGLILYTDGVTEGFNPEREAFGEARLLAFANASRASGQLSAPALVDAVADFTGEAPQSDDITVLTIRRS